MPRKFFDELSSSFDPEILPVYTCIWELYRICDDYISDHGCMQWRFSPVNPSMVKLQQILKSFQHYEVNFFYHTDPLLFDDGSAIFVEAYMSHLWGKMFDIILTDRVCEAISPSRRSKRSSKRY